MESTRIRRSGRWTITIGAGLVALGVLSFNAWANFTASSSKDNTIGTGTMTIVLADGPTAFSSDITNMVPGDYGERFVDMHTGGTLTMQNIKLATNATSSSLLDTDGTNGLQLKVDNCDQAWTLHGGATATCGGAQSAVLTQRAVIFASTTLSNVHLDGTTDHLRFQWYLPGTADDTFQGLTSTIRYTFSGTQPANTYH
jgi:hypothetical protein